MASVPAAAFLGGEYRLVVVDQMGRDVTDAVKVLVRGAGLGIKDGKLRVEEKGARDGRLDLHLRTEGPVLIDRLLGYRPLAFSIPLH